MSLFVHQYQVVSQCEMLLLYSGTLIEGSGYCRYVAVSASVQQSTHCTPPTVQLE